MREYLRRDEDVLDTWFSSALWPFSTLGWPDQTPELARYYPTTVLVTGFDIIFFWVARMMMTGLHFMREVPFADVYIHALVRDERGAKMSKSKGNVIDPLALIEAHGADALRFTLAAMAAQGRDIKLSEQRVEGYRHFANKLWNAARFAEVNGCARVAGFQPATAKTTLNRWIAHETARAAREIGDALETYRFNEAAGVVYRFVWNVFCDWYVELAKPYLTGPDGAEKDETRAMTAWALDQILKLLHPFMPFVTEELWQVTGAAAAGEPLLVLAAWPQLDGLEDEAAEGEIGWVVDVITAVRSVRAEMNIPAGALIPLAVVDAGKETSSQAMAWGDFHQEAREDFGDRFSARRAAPFGAALDPRGRGGAAARRRRRHRGRADAAGEGDGQGRRRHRPCRRQARQRGFRRPRARGGGRGRAREARGGGRPARQDS